MLRPIYFAAVMIANTLQGFYVFKISSKILSPDIVIGKNVGESRAWEYYSAYIIEVLNSVLGDPRELYSLITSLRKDLIQW
jgi:hypothetical protein